ncbi:adenosine receptor A3-like [Oculina patagonica]
MLNVTENFNHTSIEDLFCKVDVVETHLKILVSTINIPLSITAFIGNMLIIVALQKPSRSLHPPSKLLFGCLASTDLCVGLITQPLHVIYLMSTDHYYLCYYVGILSITIGIILGGLSLCTLTAISVDRLLVLKLGLRYKQVVTLRRSWVIVLILLLCNTAIAMTFFSSLRITAAFTGVVVALCTVTATFCYTKIYSILRHHRTTVQGHVKPGQPNGGGIPRNIARYRKTVSSALWVQLTLVACYLPHNIVVIIFAISGSATPSFAITWAVTLTLVYLNSSLNPFLYCWKMREVRRGVKDTIRKIWRSSK